LNADVLIVTCAEPDALPHLLSLSSDELAHATLISTGDVVRSAERQTPIASALIITGITAIKEARRLTDAGRNVVVIVAPDPWGPINGKGFVRARLLAPWFLGPRNRADLLELDTGGRKRREARCLTRAALARRLYLREVRLLAEYLLKVGLGQPAGAVARQLDAEAGSRPTLAALPRVLLGAALAVPNSLATLCRILPFILRTELRAWLRAEDS
jgi:hypothetical protein